MLRIILRSLNTVPFPPAVIMFAYVLDLVLGDPEWLPHPVRWMGAFIATLERALRKRPRSASRERLLGAVLALVTVAAAYGVTLSLLHLSYRFSRPVFFILATYFVWTSIAIKSLKKEAREVVSTLRARGVEEARARLSRIVGRDTQDLSEKGVLKAVVESVSENTSDGIVAPLFYLALGGPALMVAYKAVNTLDSMVGYKNERYLNLGRFSAKLDDIANFIPARITAFLIVCSVFLLGYNCRGSLKILARDRRNHPSPNSGYPEAAVAGALGVRLGGAMSYGGVVCEKPSIGDNSSEIDYGMVDSTIKIMGLTAFAMVGLTFVARFILIFLL